MMFIVNCYEFVLFCYSFIGQRHHFGLISIWIWILTVFVNTVFFMLGLIDIGGLIFAVGFMAVQMGMRMGIGNVCWTLLLMLALIGSFFLLLIYRMSIYNIGMAIYSSRTI